MKEPNIAEQQPAPIPRLIKGRPLLVAIHEVRMALIEDMAANETVTSARQGCNLIDFRLRELRRCYARRRSTRARRRECAVAAAVAALRFVLDVCDREMKNG